MIDTQFNAPLLWDTSSAVNMSSMFEASSFNQDISSWNTANVVDLSFMFAGAWHNFYGHPFNQNLSSWNVGKACDLESMFYASNFNQDLNSWGPQLNARRCDGETAPNVLNMFLDSECTSEYTTPILHHYCQPENLLDPVSCVLPDE